MKSRSRGCTLTGLGFLSGRCTLIGLSLCPGLKSGLGPDGCGLLSGFTAGLLAEGLSTDGLLPDGLDGFLYAGLISGLG